MKETKAAITALRNRAKQLELAAKALEKLDRFADNYRPATKRKLTAQGRKNIAAAQKKRWKIFKGGKKAA